MALYISDINGQTTIIPTIAGHDDTSSMTLDSNDKLLMGYTAMAKSIVYTGTIPTRNAAEVTVQGAAVTIPSGYYNAAVTKSVATGTEGTPTIIQTKNDNIYTFTPTVTNIGGYVAGTTLTGETITLVVPQAVSGEKFITPGYNDQRVDISTFQYVTVYGDSDLLSTNIRGNVEIFGVTGEYTNDANATAPFIANGKTAYARGEKLTGTAKLVYNATTRELTMPEWSVELA